LARREEPPLRRSEGSVAPQPPERAEEIREGPAKEEASGLSELERREEQELEDAGWEQVEVQGRTYWCRPDTGHLYPRGPAYDVHKKRRDQG
jgi:hypothetical protein